MTTFGRLEHIIRECGSLLVAFSGGADSTFLLKVASIVLPGRVLAVTAVSATYPAEEYAFAKKMARRFGVRHLAVKTEELARRQFARNPADRCYFCKRELFQKLAGVARREKIAVVADATTVTDDADIRPGNKAKEDFAVRSPLREAGLTKEDVRRLSKRLGLVSWNKPSQACLASRIPYGTRITPALLRRIETAERFLRRQGLDQVRVRHHNGACRIEVLPEQIPRVFRKRAAIVEKLKRLGYNYIAVDLEGYRTGSMNEVL